MERYKVEQLLQQLFSVCQDLSPSLIETHISWVILANSYAYKIKKPVKFDFLDFSTLSERKYFCERELLLNKRLAADMYIAVVGIYQEGNTFKLQEAYNGAAIEYAVKMKKMDPDLELSTLIRNNQNIENQRILKLAQKIAQFHSQAQVINKQPNFNGIKSRFNDIEVAKYAAAQLLGPSFATLITEVIRRSDLYLEQHASLFMERSTQGFVRDVHGDLHTGNILLYKDPVVFDCIEFDDELRQIDILNEVAFLCMDLEAWQRKDLSTLFFDHYTRFSGMPELNRFASLFHYYKIFCANIRAKVALISAVDANTLHLSNENEQTALRYLNLLKYYISAQYVS
ncbi:phosphotransferase [Pedobacter sp.]|uniref:phosphotransferase n=1 Tax=Pedobacter sp. TaxID=1411316 RepID=UPI003D7F6C2E